METMRYAGFIGSAYAVTGLALVGLVLRAILDHRAQLGALRRFAPRDGSRTLDV